MQLHCETGGEPGPALVLLHGLGVNGRAFDAMLPVIERHWRGRWLIPDLRGHGRSPHATPYAYAVHAADVAALLEPGASIHIIGHSMGGVVAMALATGWFGVAVTAALAFGVKLAWTAEEVAKLKALAQKPVSSFATQDEALDRYLRVSGMAGHVAPGSEVARAGITRDADAFRLRADPRTLSVAGPDIAQMYRAANAPVRLAAGSEDPMVTPEQMRALDPNAVVAEGVGHNVHLERPEAVWEAFAPLIPAG